MPTKVAPSLPLEMVLHIMTYITPEKENQSTLHSATLVSRSWYSAALPKLYECPYVDGNNFDRFVRTICPSVNAHVRKTDLADMIRVLDMSHLVHDSSRSLTARILGRVKNNMHHFIAPCTSFSLNSFSALSKCDRLNTLNLAWVSEYISIDRLFNSISKVTSLQSLHLSRLTLSDAMTAQIRLGKAPVVRGPPNLRHLQISGNTTNAAADFLGATLSNLESFSIGNCKLDFVAEARLLRELSPGLKSLELGRGFNNLISSVRIMPMLDARRSLQSLSITEVSVVDDLIEGLAVTPNDSGDFSIESLTLDFKSLDPDQMIQTLTEGPAVSILFDAVAEGPLRNLRRLYLLCSEAENTDTTALKKDLADLADLLEALENEQVAERADGSKPRQTGVWLTHH